MNGTLRNALTAIAALAVAFFIGHAVGRSHSVTTTETHRDTTIVTETLTVEKPVPYAVRTRDSIFVPVLDTICFHDTVFVSLPREVKEYKDSTYYARVSGYRPNLDYIEVYRADRLITVTEKGAAPKLSLGVQLGCGVQYGLIGKSFDVGPQIGVGLQYRF